MKNPPQKIFIVRQNNLSCHCIFGHVVFDFHLDFFLSISFSIDLNE